MTDRAKPSEEKVWLKHFPNAPKSVPEKTMFQLMISTNGDRMDSAALNFNGKRITFNDLVRMTDEISASLWSKGIKENDSVTLITVAVPDSVALLYSLNRIGAAANTIDPRMDVDTIIARSKAASSKVVFVLDVVFPKAGYLLRDAGLEVVVIPTAAKLGPLMRMLFNIKVRPKIEYGNGIVKWKDFIAAGKGVEWKEAPYQGDRVAVITYTGGTTGIPKGVMLTNDSVNSVACNFLGCGFKYDKGETFLGIIPMFTSYGVVSGLHMPLCMGGEVIMVPKFTPDDIGRLVVKHRPNHMIGTPAFYEILMNSEEAKNADLSFLRTLGSGGDTINASLEDKLDAFLNAHNMHRHICQGYGLSEVSSAATFCVDDVFKRGSVGVPSALSHISVFDPETGEELDYNQEGEICITGPILMKGYWNNPEETAKVMIKHDDGNVWLHTGDIGYMDEDGFIFIKDRIKRIIIRFDGHKVFPKILEESIMSHPEVNNCVVIGVNDRAHEQGYQPFAIVEFKGDVPEGGCKKLMEECNAVAEERGRLVGMISIPSIPITGMGKNDFVKLEKEYRDYDYVSNPPSS